MAFRSSVKKTQCESKRRRWAADVLRRRSLIESLPRGGHPAGSLELCAGFSRRNFRGTGALVQFAGDLFMSSSILRSMMSMPDDEKPGNVVRLGTETLFAIGEELRRMYDSDLHSKPSERLERLMALIERGNELP